MTAALMLIAALQSHLIGRYGSLLESFQSTLAHRARPGVSGVPSGLFAYSFAPAAGF